MASRDPFPMSSSEAQSLEASIEDGRGDEEQNWGSMNMNTAVSGPSASSIAATKTADGGVANQGLTGSSKQKKGKKASAFDEADDNDSDQEDVFLDRPISESRATPLERQLNSMIRLFRSFYNRLYGDSLPPSEMLRTICLASTLFFMIGGYWLLRSLKDPVLTALCGVTVIPRAKMLSLFVVLGVVSFYNHLLDSDIERHKLFYIFGSFYFFLFAIISLCLMNDSIGLANQQPNPFRILGWISYVSIESFGSVMVSLFWSFANSNFNYETAKSSYGVMVATAQIGSILGPTIVHRYSETMGVANIYMIGAFCMLFLQGTMYMYIYVYGTANRNVIPGAAAVSVVAPKKKKKEAAGILEGLILFWEHNYVKGIFAISCLFMVEVTIIDYFMKVLATDYVTELHPCTSGMSCWKTDGNHGLSEGATGAFTTFMGLFGQATNTLSFCLSLFGTSAIIRFLGLRWALLLFPSLCLTVIVFVRFHPTLYVVFAAMILLKAFSYALNNPTKEMLYQPTSSAVRYKAKSWIDIFGARGSKAMGSLVTNAFSDSAQNLIANGSLVGMTVASFLIWNATFMGKKFEEYHESGYIVGESAEDKETANMEMASNQNETKNTSCAIMDDDDGDDDALGLEEDDKDHFETEESAEEDEAVITKV